MIKSAVVVTLAGVCVSASAQLIIPGSYRLSNHPDGNAASPYYGLRLDELVDVTSGHDRFTFDFEHELSFVQLDYDGESIHIHGQSWGGRDIGSVYADDEHLGVYEIDFTYAVGLGQAPGDDDLVVTADMQSDRQNTGSIVRPTGQTIGLWDKSAGTYTFRLGDKNNDQGHRGFDGISGWGWMNHGDPNAHVNASDWLFTATRMPVPAPATSVLAVAGAVVARRKR